MAQVVSPTVSDVLTDVRAFVLSVVGSTVPVIQGIQNRVPAPLPATGFVVMTPLYQARLAYNEDTYSVPGNGVDPPTTLSVKMSTRIDIQLDVYGPASGSWVAMLAALWKDDYCCDLMQNCQPLYADEARMMPMIDSEAQYEQRWSLTATAQYNPVVTPAQTFGDAVDLTLVNVQEAYPD